MNITPTDEQWKAIKKVVAWYKGGVNTPLVFYLAGYAGTGKSTIAKFVIDELATQAGFNVATAAFTGKAANVLRQKGNPNAGTFHAGMYMPQEDDHGQVFFHLQPDAPFSCADLILGDECSMINEELGVDAESFGKKILVMGDPGQLPPVSGVGYWTGRKPDVFLTEVHRQAMDSPILRLATMLRLGKAIPEGEWSDSEGNVTRVLKTDPALTSQWMYREETQGICGIHTNRWGHTQRIRKKRGFEGKLPQKGERVLCCRNDKEKGIFNGSFGTMLSNARDTKRRSDNILIDVDMDDLRKPLTMQTVHPYMFYQHFDSSARRPVKLSKGVQEFDWGYVLTCHKAQGSEWDDVTVLDDGGVFKQDQHKWRYTAATRASKSLTFLKRQ